MIANRPPFVATEELQRTAQLILKYPILALPSAVAGVVLMTVIVLALISALATVLAGSAAGHAGAAAGALGAFLIGGILLAIGLAVVYVGQAMVVASAPFVLEDQPPNLGIALRVTMARLPSIATAAVATFLLTLIPAALCLVLIGIPLLLVLGYFLMYVPAAVVIGNEGGIAAIKTSFRIATTRTSDSVICWLGTILALVAGSIAQGFTIHIPVANLVAGFAIGGFTSAYAALLSVRFYLALRDSVPAPPQPVYTPEVTTNPNSGPPSVIR